MRPCIALLLLAAFWAASFPAHATADTEKRLKIGFVYISPVGDAGWSFAHDLGRRKLAQNPANRIYLLEGVPGGDDAEHILRDMSSRGYDIIFATSHDYMSAIGTVAAEFPQVTYLHCSGIDSTANLSAYFGRMYQARYLSGMVAGAMTKSDKIGFVAPQPLAEVIRAINALTLGARNMNPNARVYVEWTNTWYDPKVEREAAERLVSLGVDVIAQHQDSPMSQIVAEKAGIYSIGYHTDMSSHAPNAHLVASAWNWSKFYEEVTAKVRAGTWTSGVFWPGIETGIVDISQFGSMVPRYVQERVMYRRQEIIDGRFVVFRGPVRDQAGKLRISAGGTTPTDADLLKMDWFVEGVVGRLEQ